MKKKIMIRLFNYGLSSCFLLNFQNLNFESLILVVKISLLAPLYFIFVDDFNYYKNKKQNRKEEKKKYGVEI